MDKCFEGIQRIKFDKDDCVYGMISAEKEEVNFLKKIDVNEGEKKGNVENWMLEIESQMISSLKSLAKEGLGTYLQTERTTWCLALPGQLVLCIS